MTLYEIGVFFIAIYIIVVCVADLIGGNSNE